MMKSMIRGLVLAGLLAGTFSELPAASAGGTGAKGKVGVTIAFRDGYGSQQYVSNAAFKSRPVAEDMAKQGIDLCYYAGWRTAKSPLESLKQFNAIWLVIDHEDQCPYPVEETIRALTEYVKAGGGLVITHSGGRYAEAPVDKYWTKVYAAFGLELLHEEVIDDASKVEVDKWYDLFRVEDFADHPIAKGVPGLWLPIRRADSWGVTAFKTSPEWQWIARTAATARSVPKGKIDNYPKWDQPGTYAKGPIPVVVARTFGKGRIVFEAIHKDCCGWAYKIDKWPNWVERSTFNGKPGDALKLLENACAWAANPSLADASFTRNYKPVEPDYPPYRRIDTGRLPDEKADDLLGAYTGAGTIFGVTGGVMEAALRTAYCLITKEAKPPAIEFSAVRGMDGVKTATIDIKGTKVNICVAHQMGNVEKVLDQVREDLKAGKKPRYDFIEVMACRGGCIGGGGQPCLATDAVRAQRTAGLYSDDEKSTLRMSHLNPEVQALYNDYLGKTAAQGGEKAEKLLHTHYHKRECYKFAGTCNV